MALVVWEPPAGQLARFGVLYVPPAFDEMNKARRMAAIQARALARAGGVVAVLDPRGTGDSEGSHGDATWTGWRDDVRIAWDWLAGRVSGPRLLWGLRMGALLVADIASAAEISPAGLLLWQPVNSGRGYFNQFFRVAAAQQLTGGNEGRKIGQSLRARLEGGMAVELAGYEVHPLLVRGAEAVDLRAIRPPRCPIIWRESCAGAPVAISPVSAKVLEHWRDHGANVDVAAVAGPSFWATQEVEEAPYLIDSSTDAVARCVRHALE